MGVQFFLLLALTLFEVDTFPIKNYLIDQRQIKEYEVFKDILIKNLIVTTDNLKLILNWERENIMYRIQDEEKLNTKMKNYNTVKNLLPFQYATKSKDNDEETSEDRIKPENKVPGSHKAKDVPVSLNSFELSKYLSKRSPDEVEKPTEYEIKSKIEVQKDEKENYGEPKAGKKRESYEYSPVIVSEENFLNNGNSYSSELDNNSDSKYTSGKVKRQADGENPLPIPTGGGDTQMFMGTFQAVMRPMKLPSLG